MARTSPDNYSFSHTEMSTYKECKRRWWLQYIMKLRRSHEPRAKARETGTLVHGALEQFYVAGGMGGEKAVELMTDWLKAAYDEDMLKVAEVDRADVADTHKTALILALGYVEWLEETGADIGLKFDPNPSEVELRAPGPIEGTEIMGVIDLAGTDERSGDLIVMDTKVTNSIDDMIKTLHIGEQGPMYAILAKLNDSDPDRGFRVIWNMIKRSKQTARAKPPHYLRYELAINPDQLRQFYLQLQGQMEEMLRTEARLAAGESHVKVAYPTPSKDCSWKCPYFAVCGAMNDITRNDVDFIVRQYYTTPEQREAARIEAEQERRHAAQNTPEGE